MKVWNGLGLGLSWDGIIGCCNILVSKEEYIFITNTYFTCGISKTLTLLLYSSFNGFTTFLTTRFCNNFYFSQSSSSVTIL